MTVTLDSCYYCFVHNLVFYERTSSIRNSQRRHNGGQGHNGGQVQGQGHIPNYIVKLTARY